MEHTLNENVQNELLSFGWGVSPGFSILGMLLSALFNPSATIYGRHPFPDVNDEEFMNEIEKTSTEEERQEVLKAHLDEY